MSRPDYEIDERIGEDLFLAYRAGIKDPAYNATDQALLRAAAYNDTCRWPRQTFYAALTMSAAALGLVLFFTMSPNRLRMKIPHDQYQISAMLDGAYARDDLQQATLALQFEVASQYAT